MKFIAYRLLILLIVLTGTFTLTDCRSKSADSQQETSLNYGQTKEDESSSQSNQHHRAKHHHGKRHRQQADSLANQAQPDQRIQLGQKGAIPQKVFDVLAYVRQNGHAMNGYVGGRRFGNFENRLPKTSATGQPIQYQEWDVNPKVQGRNRGTERLITGSDNRAYFTNDHYNSFTEVK